MLPSIYVGHGAPTLPLTSVPARQFLQRLPSLLPDQPRAILVVSAHWETMTPHVSAVELNETIHDFQGFPRELYEFSYPAPGSPALAARVVDLLRNAGYADASAVERGLDHGAWIPLLLMYPEAYIPIVQLSLMSGLDAADHLALGTALAPLREEGVLILGSGSLTHDLSQFRFLRDSVGESEPTWVSAFAEWVDLALSEGRINDLINYRREAPFASRNHPTEEHLLPLFVALGAVGIGAIAKRLHASTTYGVLRMDTFSFAGAENAKVFAS